MIRKLLERRRFMREHEWTDTHLSEYVDDELSASERQRVEQHVGLCPECRRLLDTLKRTIKGLAGLRTEPRPGLADGVIDRLRHS